MALAAYAPAASADEILGRAETARPVAFDVMMPLRNRESLDGFVASLTDPSSPRFHHWLTPKEFGLRFGPDATSVNIVAHSLRARGFNVTVQTRSIHATGTAAQVEANFGMHLMLARNSDGVLHAVQDAEPKLPSEIAATGAHLLSFRAHNFLMPHRVARRHVSPLNRYTQDGTYWFDDLKQAYSYPSVQGTIHTYYGKVEPYDGTGVTLGVLISSDVFDGDIKAVFDHENWSTISGRPDPTIYARRPVNGGAGTTVNGQITDALFEASLDTQEELTGAPGAHLVLYDIPDLTDGNVAAGYIAIDEDDEVDLVSSSFGGPELGYDPSYDGGQSYYGILQAMHELFLQGNAEGITFLASSGDNAGLPIPSVSYFEGMGGTFVAGVESPASDPNVTAVGGTNVVTNFTPGSLDSTYVRENAWSDPEVPQDPYGVGVDATGATWGAGGGYSVLWARPGYQAKVTTGSTTKRAVPDVGMQVGGCPLSAIANPTPPYCTGENNPLDGNGNSDRSAVIVAIDDGSSVGGLFGVIGTSVASPEFAGAMALLIERVGRVGNLNPYLYNFAALQAAGKGTYFHTNIPGYNGVVNTDLNATYSLSVGVGTPIVSALVGAPKNAPLSGVPQTPSNP
jgi:subtilase family serine protease